MTIYSSQQIANNTQVSKKGAGIQPDYLFRSALLEENEYLYDIARNRHLLSKEETNGGTNLANIKNSATNPEKIIDAIRSVKIGLYLAIPEVIKHVTQTNNVTFETRFNEITNRFEFRTDDTFDQTTEDLVELYQDCLSTVYNSITTVNDKKDFVFSGVDGIVGFNTIKSLDRQLSKLEIVIERDPLFIKDPRFHKVLYNKVKYTRPVGAFTRVPEQSTDAGPIKLRKEPRLYDINRYENIVTEEKRVDQPADMTDWIFVEGNAQDQDHWDNYFRELGVEERVYIKEIITFPQGNDQDPLDNPIDDVSQFDVNTPTQRSRNIWLKVEVEREASTTLYSRIESLLTLFGYSTLEELQAEYDFRGISREVGFIRGNGQEAWLRSEMPEPNAKLYKIKGDDTMLKIAEANYDSTSVLDLRFFGNALVHVNNPKGNGEGYSEFSNLDIAKKPILALNNLTGKYDDQLLENAALYIDDSSKNWLSDSVLEFDDDGVTRFIFEKKDFVLSLADRTIEAFNNQVNSLVGDGFENWDNAELIEGKYIWVPSQQFAESLINVVNIGSYSNAIKTEIINILGSVVQDNIDNFWKVGTGYTIDASIGATFGIPVAVDSSAYFRIVREDTNIFKVFRRGNLDVGIDVGVGAGFTLGNPKKRARSEEEKAKKLGISADAFAGVRDNFIELQVQQEIEFNIVDDAQAASLIVMLAQSIVSTVNTTAGAILAASANALGIDPSDYTTKLSYKLGSSIAADVGVTAGLQLPDSKEGNEPLTNGNNVFANGGNTNISKKEGLNLQKILSWFEIGLGAGGTVELAGGIEIEFKTATQLQRELNQPIEPKDNIDEEIGLPYPKQTKVGLFFEGGGKTSFNAGFFESVLQYYSGIEVAGGVKLELTYIHDESHYSKDGFEFIDGIIQNITLEGVTFYQKTGDLDVFSGAASRFELKLKIPGSYQLGDPFPFTPPSTINEALSYIDGLEYTRRFSQEIFLGRKYRAAKRLNTKLSGLMNRQLDRVYRGGGDKSSPNKRKTLAFFGGGGFGYLVMKVGISMSNTTEVPVDTGNPAAGTMTVTASEKIEKIIEDIINTQGKNVGDALLYIPYYFLNKELKEEVNQILDFDDEESKKAFDELTKDLVELFESATIIEARYIVGVAIGLALGARIALGAKAAIRASVEASYFIQGDFKEELILILAEFNNELKGLYLD